MKKIIVVALLLAMPLIQGCALLGAAAGAAAAYGIYQATRK
jgi:hypothetical protein